MKGFTKILALTLVCVFLLSALVACGGTADDTDKGQNTETQAPTTDTPQGGQYDASFDRNSVKDNVPTDLSFEGETLTFFVRNDEELWQYEMDVNQLMDDTLYDAIYYRNLTVEERLGITIDTISAPGNYTKRAEWNDTLRTAVNTKLDDYQAAAIYLSTGSVLAVEGLYYNVMDFDHIDLDKPWWNQSIQDELTMFNTLYYLAGDIAVTELTGTFCMGFNKNLYDKYYGSTGVSLYDVVEEKKWTIDYMYDLVQNVHEDLDGNGAMSDGDVVGYTAHDPNTQDSWNDAWIASCGINITTKVDGIPEFSFYSDRTIRAHEAVRRLSVTCPGTFAGGTRDLTTFTNGNVMFVRTNLNGGASWREMKDPYGILPLPMLEENQDGGYATTVNNTSSLIVILSSLPDEKKELVGASLELLAAESYKQVTPTYFEVAVKTKYAADQEDARMYDLIINSVRFSFGYCYSTESLRGGKNGLPIGALFRIINDDLALKYAENAEAYQENLDKLIDGLDEAAFNAMYS